MHLLGNMWAQQWHIDHIILPYPVEVAEDMSDRMMEMGYNVQKMFKDAEEFFESIGLKPMPPSFWNMSVMEKPTDGREIICHASAWDFGINNDVRIKQCSRITAESYITVHHEVSEMSRNCETSSKYFINFKHFLFHRWVT